MNAKDIFDKVIDDALHDGTGMFRVTYIDPKETSQVAPLARAPASIVLPYPISANRYWTSRAVKSKKTGKDIVLTHPSTEAQAFRTEVQWLAAAAGVRKPLTGRIDLTVQLYPKRPLDFAKRARKDPDGWEDSVQCIDLGNCEKVLCDALNGIAWVDDKQIRRMILLRESPDEHGPRCVVTFSEMIATRTQGELL